VRRRRLSKRERMLVLQSQNYCCAYCNAKLLISKFTVDHIKPYSAGGVTSFENSAATCPACNSKKGARYDAEITGLAKRPSS
jgi:5-methylcytosine-specific restriction endonuclease McrA